MKLLALSVLLCAVMALTRAAADVEVAKRTCLRGWTKIGHRFFFYVPQCLTWLQAEQNCRELGGHLASVHSSWEYRQIQALVQSRADGSPPAWLGLNDCGKNGQWRWSDGTCFNYQSWCCGEPNNANHQYCLQMNFSDNKCWDDVQCEHRLPSVCVRTQTS